MVGSERFSEVFGHPREFSMELVSQNEKNPTMHQVPIKMGVEKRHGAKEPIRGWRIWADGVLEAARLAGIVAFVQETTEGCEERVIYFFTSSGRSTLWFVWVG